MKKNELTLAGRAPAANTYDDDADAAEWSTRARFGGDDDRLEPEPSVAVGENGVGWSPIEDAERWRLTPRGASVTFGKTCISDKKIKENS